MELFASEDPRERDYIKTIIHRLYGKVMAMRGIIRKQISMLCSRVVYDYEDATGIAEILEIVNSII